MVTTTRESIDEALSQGLCRIIEMDGWEAVANPVGGANGFKTFTFGRPLTLLCGPETVGLQFLRHEWSGTVKITTDEGEHIVPLSNDDGVDTVSLEFPARERNFQITIEALPVQEREVGRCEVWLLGVLFNDVPRPIGRSMLLNSQARLVYGDWGEFLVVAGDDIIPGAIVREGSWAPDDIKLFKKHVRVGDLVLDVGANFGHHSVVFSKLVSSTGLVIAIEPQWCMYQLIHANAALNGCENIIPLHAAAGQERRSITMYPANEDENNFGRLGVNTDAVPSGGEEVFMYPLDDLLPNYLDGRQVAFVKIDVQSYELYVLQGMENILRRDRPTLFIEISPYWMKRAGYAFVEIYNLLARYGYSFVHREGLEPGLDGIPDVPPEHDIEWDLLAVHRGQFSRA